ncbi:MAG: hydrolase TatD [Deltaproteobacteria bacterium]|nr:hydrolase TatD [Deltaproteobacteria bacterium]
MPLFDSHCHLDVDAFDGAAGVDAVVARAREAGVLRMLAIGSGYGFESAARALAVADRHDDVWASVGVHPHDADQWTEERWAELEQMASSPRVVALGEMGLDFHYDNSPRDTQRNVFRHQIRCAKSLNLPIIIHDRDSDGETMAILDEEDAWSGRGVVYHCFTGTVSTMEQIVERGGYVSIPGIVTFKKAEDMREVATHVPLDRFFIETDSPFLTPVPFRGKRNEPARVGLVAEKIAELRGIETSVVADATWQNASRFFALTEAK